MTDYENKRSPEEIEREVERTRANVSSTIDEIQSRLTPGQMMDQAVAYARTSLPADFGANLSNTVRDNPVPVALIGVGIAWLMSSSRYADGQARLRRQMAEHDVLVGADTGESREGALRHAASKASELGHRVSDKSAAIAGRAREVSSGARARLDEVSHRSQERYYRAKDSFSHMVEEQPLVLGALGVAVGTVLGALLPSTRREDELMGRTRDHLLESAKETAREQADTMKESAQRVAKAAKQEADRARAETGFGTRGNGPVTPAGASGADLGAPGSAQGLPH